MATQLRLILAFALLASLAALPDSARAEGDNAFDGETVIRNEGPTDGGASDPIVKNSVGDVNSIQDKSAENDRRGRRQKIEDDAIPKGQAGVGAAIAAGVALTAAGTPMLMSPLLPVQLRGAALLAKAGLEFAQAAATAGTNQQNKKAADAVGKASDGPTGSELASPEDVKKAAAESINTPELQKALGEAGINSDNFVNQLVNGELSSPAAVMGAAGVDTSKFSADQIAAASSSTNGHEELPHVTYNDQASSTPAGNGGGSGGDQGQLSQNGQKENGAGGASQDPAEVYSQAQALASRAMAMARQSGADKLLHLNEHDLVEKYLAQLMKANSSKQALAASDMALYDLGIKRLRPKQTIFQVARKSYHDFGRWRGKRPARLAQAGPAALASKP